MHWLPNFLAASRHEFRPLHGFGVDRNLVGAREQQAANILQRAHAAADGQRHEAMLGRAAHDIEQDATLFVAGRDVEEAQFVGPGLVIDHGLFDRIAGIAQADEVHALDDATVLHIEAGNDADLQHVSYAFSPWRRC